MTDDRKFRSAAGKGALDDPIIEAFGGRDRLLRVVEIPDLRMRALDHWRPGGPFRKAAELTVALGHYLHPDWEFLNMSAADLWFVGADMCALLDAARQDLPSTTLTPELMPSPSGLVVFARPMMGIDAGAKEIGIAGGDRSVHVSAALWGPGIAGWTEDQREALGISSYAFVEDVGIYPLGGATWLMGNDSDQLLGQDLDNAQELSMIEDRRTLAALWLLSSQPGVADVRHVHPQRQTAKREQRAGRQPSRIRVIRLRAAVDETGDHEATGSRREYHERWVVSGHWRQQAYGPQHSLRRPTWIAPYIKGPADKPFVEPETVKAWIR